MKKSSFIAGRYLLALCLLTQSGCAAVFARDEMPNIEMMVAGTDRKTVEAELGKPISVSRVSFSEQGYRRAVYKLMLRTKIDENASSSEQIKNKMLGYTNHTFQIVYDKRDRVLLIRKLDDEVVSPKFGS